MRSTPEAVEHHPNSWHTSVCLCLCACVTIYITHTSHVLLFPGIARCLTPSGVLRIVQHFVLMDTVSESDCVHDKAGSIQ